MSTRVLGLLTTTAAAALALGGCIGPASASPAPPPSTSNADAATAASSPKYPSQPASPEGAASAAKDGTDLKACYDAECEVQVKNGQKIPLNPEYGLDSVEVRIKGTLVIFTAHGRNSKMVSSMDTSWAGSASSSSSNVNGITFEPRMTKDGNVILKITRD